MADEFFCIIIDASSSTPGPEKAKTHPNGEAYPGAQRAQNHTRCPIEIPGRAESPPKSGFAVSKVSGAGLPSEPKAQCRSRSDTLVPLRTSRAGYPVVTRVSPGPCVYRAETSSRPAAASILADPPRWRWPIVGKP